MLQALVQMSSAELSEGWGVGAWCSAIQPEPAHFFGPYFLSSHEEATPLPAEPLLRATTPATP